MKKLLTNRLLIILSCVLPLLVAGCVAPVKHNTPSGKPEVTIQHVTKSKAKDALTNYFADMGYSVSRSDDSVVALDRPLDDPTEGIIVLGTNSTNARITCSLIQVGQNVRVIADISLVGNPGTGFEKRVSLNENKDSLRVQDWLNAVQVTLERN